MPEPFVEYALTSRMSLDSEDSEPPVKSKSKAGSSKAAAKTKAKPKSKQPLVSSLIPESVA